jgi:hypothetical protein
MNIFLLLEEEVRNEDVSSHVGSVKRLTTKQLVENFKHIHTGRRQ